MNKRRTVLGTILTLCVIAWPGLAQHTLGDPQQTQQQVTQVFSIAKMTCAACPITIKKAMSRVEGVESVKVDFKAKTATAVFDPHRTTSNAIAQASTEVGYPAKLMEEDEYD